MEVEVDGKIPFIGMDVTKKDGQLETEVYIKPTNTGLLLHYQSHVDKRYKRSLITKLCELLCRSRTKNQPTLSRNN